MLGRRTPTFAESVMGGNRNECASTTLSQLLSGILYLLFLCDEIRDSLQRMNAALGRIITLEWV